MSAPETNTEQQARRHWPPLIGMAGGLVVAAIAAVVLLGFLSFPADEQATPVPTEPELAPETGQ